MPSVVLPEPGTPSTRYNRRGVKPPPKTSSNPATPEAAMLVSSGPSLDLLIRSFGRSKLR